MSYTTYGQQGLDAVKAKEWPRAIDLLSRGLAAGTSAPQWLLARAHAYQETGQYARAIADAERAYLAALVRQHPKKRDHLFAAQYRRAVVLGHLRRYADADACCVWAQQLIEGKNFHREADDVATHMDADGNYLATPEEAAAATAKMPRDEAGGSATGNSVKGLPEWAQAYSMRTVMLRAMQALPEDDPGRKITVKRVPDPPAEEPVDDTKETETKTMAQSDGSKAVPAGSSTAQPTPPKKLRVDFYQTPEAVSLSLYAKGVDKMKMKMVAYRTAIYMTGLPESVVDGGIVRLQLGGGVDISTQELSVTPYKIELKFKKQPADVKWRGWGEQAAPDVHADAPAMAAMEPTAIAAAAPTPVPAAVATAPAAPAYPTSAQRGQKNWDAVVRDEEADAPADGDVNGFFKQLFASSTPEQQRAMVKSFVESNGTTLSTDWASVAKGTVETKPPEGVEAKKW